MANKYVSPRKVKCSVLPSVHVVEVIVIWEQDKMSVVLSQLRRAAACLTEGVVKRSVPATEGDSN